MSKVIFRVSGECDIAGKGMVMQSCPLGDTFTVTENMPIILWAHPQFPDSIGTQAKGKTVKQAGKRF